MTAVETPFPKLDFELPASLEAGEPPEARGLSRDEVRLMVSHFQHNRIEHSSFRELPRFLQRGDVLVVNTSGTLSAALPVARADGRRAMLHLSTRLPAGLWSVELRRIKGASTAPCLDAERGERLRLPDGGAATLLAPHRSPEGPPRLWLAELSLPQSVEAYLSAHGSPIRYSYVKERWPAEHYQTVFATEMGSAEMPSAGRAFTPELVTRLVARGVQIAPLLLHTGVASLERHEPPYEEFYRVPLETAGLVNAARAARRRVIAVGTTAVRALETVADTDGLAHPGEGWTDLVITPERGMRLIDGLITGLHEPQATHLAMLAALCGIEHLQHTYAEALRKHYLWHEFGDMHLILK